MFLDMPRVVEIDDGKIHNVNCFANYVVELDEMLNFQVYTFQSFSNVINRLAHQ